MKEHFTLRYSANQDGDSVMDLEMTFDNLSDEQLLCRMNAWLQAIGKTNIKVNLDTKCITTNIITTNVITTNTTTFGDVIDNYSVE